MGGMSSSEISITTSGYGVFSGSVSTKNNGGFALVRCQLNQISIGRKKAIELRIKGDSKVYQLRIKDQSNLAHGYVGSFQTSSKWETVRIELANLYPSYRGRKLALPNFNATVIDEVSILIANNKNELFKLLIDTIQLV